MFSADRPRQQPPVTRKVAAQPPTSSTMRGLLAMQRSVGNTAVQQLLTGRQVQRAVGQWVKPASPSTTTAYTSDRSVPDVYGSTPGTSKPRAYRVEAVFGGHDLNTGSAPSVEPVGWDYAGRIPMTPRRTGHAGWVRFHLLSAACGGSGSRYENLVTVAQVYNSGQLWRNFEDNQFYALRNGAYPAVALEIDVSYHQNITRAQPKPGDSQLEKFPSLIDGQWWGWDPARGAWLPGGTAQLILPRPVRSFGRVEMVMTARRDHAHRPLPTQCACGQADHGQQRHH